MAKYVRSKRRVIGGSHHHKGKAKAKGKSKGKNRGCNTVKKCRAEIKKLETRIRKIQSRKKKAKSPSRKRLRMKTPKELETMYMDSKRDMGAAKMGRKRSGIRDRPYSREGNPLIGFGIIFKQYFENTMKMIELLVPGHPSDPELDVQIGDASEQLEAFVAEHLIPVAHGLKEHIPNIIIGASKTAAQASARAVVERIPEHVKEKMGLTRDLLEYIVGAIALASDSINDSTLSNLTPTEIPVVKHMIENKLDDLNKELDILGERKESIERAGAVGSEIAARNLNSDMMERVNEIDGFEKRLGSEFATLPPPLQRMDTLPDEAPPYTAINMPTDLASDSESESESEPYSHV